MLLPDSNLPSSSLPWAREVVKQLDDLSRAVNTNEVNNAARDATTETNISNLSELMADQIELTGYSSEMPGTRTNTFAGTGFQLLDTSLLTQTINLNKDRTAFISYSSSYDVKTDFAVTNAGFSWYISVQIFVNGVLAGYTLAGKGREITTGTNPYLSEYEENQLIFNKLVRLSAGPNTISVRVDVGHVASTSSVSTRINVSDDDLLIDIIK